MKGIITKGIAGFYYVESGNEVFECKAKGIFRKDNITPCVGDIVEFSVPSDGYACIDKIMPRKNHLIRPPISNIDTLMIIVSVTKPEPNMVVIDKMIAVACANDIEPVIIISKVDLKPPDKLFEIYSLAGIKTITASAVTKEGIQQIKSLLKGKISAFSGNSGVGKSTLLNLIDENFSMETGAISKKLKRGKHTTRHVELFKLPFGGYVADTPGFSSIDFGRFNVLKKDNLSLCFKEFIPFIGSCKFSSCTHSSEPDCAVLKAVKSGKIHESRYNSYLHIYNELKSIKDWESS